jgi:hypothetical protein
VCAVESTGRRGGARVARGNRKLPDSEGSRGGREGVERWSRGGREVVERGSRGGREGVEIVEERAGRNQ